MQVILKGSAVVCGECEEPARRCDECKTGFCCRGCMDGDICGESDWATCEACREKEDKYWAWYFGGSIKAHRDSCEALGLPSSASDAEIMEAARGLK